MRTSRSSRRQMLSRVHLLVLLLSVACGPGLAATQALHASSVGSVPHILVVLEENRSYDEVIGNSAWPQLNALAQANGLATNYFAVAHPSLPNYLALLSGSTQGVTDDGDYTFPGPAFPDELSNAGISWRAYMEGLPSPGYNGTTAGNYAKKHDPFAYFSSIANDPSKNNNIVSTDRLGNDLANANGPAFMWVSRDLMDDAHDGPDSQADSYLGGLVSQVQGSPWWRNGAGAAIIVVFDESDGDNSGIGTASNGGGQVACVVISNRGPQQYGGAVNHYGLLRTLEKIYGVEFMGNSADISNGDLLPLLPSFAGSPQPLPGPVPHPRPTPNPLPSPSPPTPNPGYQPPPSFTGIRVSAGRDQTLHGGARVTLHGTFYAPGASRILYRWRQVGGPAVRLAYTGQGNAAFVAPSLASTLIFRLDGSDGRGHSRFSLTHVRILPATLAGRPAKSPARPGKSPARPTKAAGSHSSRPAHHYPARPSASAPASSTAPASADNAGNEQTPNNGGDGDGDG